MINNNNIPPKPELIVKTRKRPPSPGESPMLKGNNNVKIKFTLSFTNRYNILRKIDENNDENSLMHTDTVLQSPTPQSIFITTPVDYLKFCDDFQTKIDYEKFLYKTTNKNLKLSLNSPQSIRLIIKLLNENSIKYFTYQIKEDKSYRVVLKNHHHSTSTKFITREFTNLDYPVKRISNI
jgi:hypothetical protein